MIPNSKKGTRTPGHSFNRADAEKGFDVIVVGSGAGALTAAITARHHGLSPLVIEKTSVVGGTSALSGGVIWCPANSLMLEAGEADSADAAFTYLQALTDDSFDDPMCVTERRKAFVEKAPEMITVLRGVGLAVRRCPGWPDYYPSLPGAASGRSLEPVPFDTRQLGSWKSSVRAQTMIPRRLKVSVSEFNAVSLAGRNLKGLRALTRVVGRSALSVLRRDSLAVRGEALVSQLLSICQRLDIPVWIDCPMEGVTTQAGRITGVTVTNSGQRFDIAARKGVVLAAGGYARNESMRDKYARQPSSVRWTSANEGETGEVLLAAMEVGAAVASMEEAWYSPSSVQPNGRATLHNPDRTKPHSIIVDATGQRFVNEAANYNYVAKMMYQRQSDVPAIPSWLVIDNQHRRHYPFATAPPGRTPSNWFSSGYMKKADTIRGLAEACGIDADGLENTVKRFNEMVRGGKDDDFQRGDSIYDHYYGDPSNLPNPALGEISSSPYYAVEVFPGDIGTCGGLVTNGGAEVLDESGKVIPGLYAVGNIAATLGSGKNWAGGATLGTAMTFGYIAGCQVASSVP